VPTFDIEETHRLRGRTGARRRCSRHDVQVGRRRRGRVGDVFMIPLADDLVAVGQVLDERVGAELLVDIFAGAHAPDEAMKVAASAPFALLGSTLDALFVHDRWVVVGRTEPRHDVRRPTFKVAVAPGRGSRRCPIRRAARAITPTGCRRVGW